MEISQRGVEPPLWWKLARVRRSSLNKEEGHADLQAGRFADPPIAAVKNANHSETSLDTSCLPVAFAPGVVVLHGEAGVGGRGIISGVESPSLLLKFVDGHRAKEWLWKRIEFVVWGTTRGRGNGAFFLLLERPPATEKSFLHVGI